MQKKHLLGTIKHVVANGRKASLTVNFPIRQGQTIHIATERKRALGRTNLTQRVGNMWLLVAHGVVVAPAPPIYYATSNQTIAIQTVAPVKVGDQVYVIFG